MNEASAVIEAASLDAVEVLLRAKHPGGRLHWWPLRRDGSRAVQAFRYEHEDDVQSSSGVAEVQLGYLKRYEDRERAREVLGKLEAGETASPAARLADDLPLFSAAVRVEKPASKKDDALERAVADLLPDEMTPREALDALYRLKALVPKQS